MRCECYLYILPRPCDVICMREKWCHESWRTQNINMHRGKNGHPLLPARRVQCQCIQFGKVWLFWPQAWSRQTGSGYGDDLRVTSKYSIWKTFVNLGNEFPLTETVLRLWSTGRILSLVPVVRNILVILLPPPPRRFIFINSNSLDTR